MQIDDIFHNCPQEQQEQQQSNPKDIGSSDRLGVTMHPAQPDWTFDEIVKV